MTPKNDNSAGNLAGTINGHIRNLAKKYKKSLIATSAIATVLAMATAYEMHTSKLQAHFFNAAAQDVNMELKAESSISNAVNPLTPNGPYNKRYGYVAAEDFANNLQNNGYRRTARTIFDLPNIFGQDLFPLYKEKDHAGLRISDSNDQDLSNFVFPTQIYKDKENIPKLIIDSLLLVENRSLGEDHPVTWNPSIEWKRLGFAALQQLYQQAGFEGSRTGGSTLATQLIKMRHSEGGRTSTVDEKIRQIAMASVKAYHDDKDTQNNISEIIKTYLNSIPYTSHPNFGEVIGFADGMAIWFGTDFEEANRLLNTPEDMLDDTEFERYSTYYRQSLALIMALQRPTQYLIEDRESLNKRIDTFLPYMIEKEIISERLGNAALRVELAFNDQGHNVAPLQNAFDFKAVDTLKAKLLKDFGMSSIYDLNRTDAHVVTTLNAQVTDRVARYLDKLSDHEFLEQENLTGFRRVNPDLANDVTYSFTLYEKTDVGNVLRVQADTFDGEFNLNENSKLELGSTAKLRTLVTYLDIIEKLHLKYTSYSPSLLQEEHENVHDSFSLWMIDHLSNSQSDKSLNGTLEAAMERRYSADHRRGFFTNGGFLRFTNFNFPDYKHDFSVKEAIQQSINLSSVRLMEDIVEHTVYADMDTDTALLEDINHKDRGDYLNRFVQYEGNVFLSRYKKELTNDRARSPEHILIENIQKKRTLTPDHLAIIHTTLYPDKTHTDFQHFVEGLREKGLVNFDEINNHEALHSKYSSERFDLNDRGYVTGLNPMSLWVAQRLIHNPDEPWSTTRLAATDIIKDSYGWLLNTDANTPKKAERILKRQNRRILVMLEKDAFEIIHSSWKKQGFPFNAMVPSLASALGSSADTPSASSELIGIIINDGKRTPITSFSEIRLAEDTPYEQHFQQQKSQSEQVIAPEVAAIALKTIQGVVEHGTARGAYNSVKLSDGRVLTVGGKTGTGDNEKRVRNSETGKLETVKKDRTAIFIFSIGEHHFGAITASVLNEKADDHGFTSSMATAVFRRIAPLLTEVLDPTYGISPEETLKARRLSEKAISMGLSPNSEYRIQSGDNLSVIAAQFESVSVSDIKIANDNISTPELISGRMLVIPLEL